MFNFLFPPYLYALFTFLKIPPSFFPSKLYFNFPIILFIFLCCLVNIKLRVLVQFFVPNNLIIFRSLSLKKISFHCSHHIYLFHYLFSILTFILFLLESLFTIPTLNNFYCTRHNYFIVLVFY